MFRFGDVSLLFYQLSRRPSHRSWRIYCYLTYSYIIKLSSLKVCICANNSWLMEQKKIVSNLSIDLLFLSFKCVMHLFAVIPENHIQANKSILHRIFCNTNRYFIQIFFWYPLCDRHAKILALIVKCWWEKNIHT